MSFNTKLEIYTLKIREKGNKTDFLNINDIAGFNLMDELHAYLQKNIYLFKINQEAQRTSRIDKNEYINGVIYSRIKVGKFGESSEIVDTLSGSGVFHKEREHSDTIPLYFRVEASAETTLTIIIQRTNNRTILPELKTILEALLNDLRENSFTFDLRPLKESVTLKNFLSSEGNSISTIELTLANEDFIDGEVSLKLKPKPRRGFSSDILDGIIEGSEKNNLKRLVKALPTNIQGLGVKVANIELRSSKYGSLKTRIGEKLLLTSSFLIPVSKEYLDKTGHPSFSKIKEISDSLLKK